MTRKEAARLIARYTSGELDLARTEHMIQRMCLRSRLTKLSLALRPEGSCVAVTIMEVWFRVERRASQKKVKRKGK